ncbi:membrane protein insertase YidC [Arthrobacter sp. EPSL27]|uniref:membrane protein insertase YidC n=1 Tax=Arthrobacter sp. EPSL27 TaxID=1745378 RepID=UPI000748BC62|nr:membrane protein insertase YidC [Arthrobacter sp. EPSL27]KUM38456.1 preprotein translocase YidC [Arthrobacter sp. EPSL27]
MVVGAALLFPFQWLVSAVLVGFHDVLGTAGMPPASGWTWTLSVIGLVLAIRAALIPAALAQGKAQRRMRRLQPDLKKLQEKYDGRTDAQSRQAMAQEQMALYKEHGTNPLSACLPLLVQVPFFLALFTVLSGAPAAAAQGKGIGAMSAEQLVQFGESSIFGAPLAASMLHGTPPGGNVGAVWILSMVMILAMTAAQFVTQRHIMARNMAAGTGPAARQQRVLLYALPAVFGAGGILFPIGVLIYWTTTNLWTMVQQFILDPGP